MRDRKKSGPSVNHRISMWALVKTGLRDRMFYRLYLLGLMLFFCTAFYYFGEVVDYFKWETLRWNVFYAVHDVHRLLFLLPVLYAAYAFGLKAAIIVTLVVGGIWMPRALFFSPYPAPLTRALLFLVAEGGLGFLVAMMLRQKRRIQRLEEAMERDRDRLLDILRRMSDGVIVVAPDFHIRFANDAMKKRFGEDTELPCYKYIYHLAEPCDQHCRLRQVIAGQSDSWDYVFPDGTTYEVVASPFRDSDGVVCQLATYRDTTYRKSVGTG